MNHFESKGETELLDDRSLWWACLILQMQSKTVGPQMQDLMILNQWELVGLGLAKPLLVIRAAWLVPMELSILMRWSLTTHKK